MQWQGINSTYRLPKSFHSQQWYCLQHIGIRLSSNARMAGKCWLSIYEPERVQMQTLVSGDGSNVNQGDSTRPWNYFLPYCQKGGVQI